MSGGQIEESGGTIGKGAGQMDDAGATIKPKIRMKKTKKRRWQFRQSDGKTF